MPAPKQHPFSNLSLAEKTSQYWRIAYGWNGHGTEQISVGQAISVISNLQNWLGPKRPLMGLVHSLHTQLIEGSKKPRKRPESKILTFKQVEQANQ